MIGYVEKELLIWPTLEQLALEEESREAKEAQEKDAKLIDYAAKIAELEK